MYRDIAKSTWQALRAIRKQRPLVYCFTNYVAMDLQANTLLSLGASPIMSFEPEEIRDLVHASSAVCVNIGCLERHQIPAMFSLFELARDKPVVFDPVGCGASEFRTKACRELVGSRECLTIKGNGSEIASLFTDHVAPKGVDAEGEVGSSLKHIILDRKTKNQIFVVTGSEDVLLTKDQSYSVKGGHPLMRDVTAMGCSLGGVIAAFQAVNGDRIEATLQALAVFGLGGSLAAEQTKAPGTFRMRFLDKLYELDESHLQGIGAREL